MLIDEEERSDPERVYVCVCVRRDGNRRESRKKKRDTRQQEGVRNGWEAGERGREGSAK